MGSQADVDTTGGSLSIAHAPSGLYVAAGGGVEETAAGDDETWHVAAGINRKWNSLGKTHFGVVYGDSDTRTDGQSASMWGFTTHQHIDAAAMEVYVQYYRLDAENDTDGDL